MTADTDGGWRPDIELLTERLARRLRSRGHPWPEMAATALRDRAETGLDRAVYAALLGVDEQAVTALEEGGSAPSPEALSLPLDWSR